MSKFTIGADPEFFIEDDNGILIKSTKFTNAGKENPLDLGGGYAVHADNVMIEMSVPPADSKDAFVNNIQTGIAKIETFIEEQKPYAKLLIEPSAKFDPKQLTSKKDKEIGCDIDFNAYNELPNPKPVLDSVSTAGVRYAGGHIHIGFKEDSPLMELKNQVKLIKALDYVFLDFIRIHDKDIKRKLVYGDPGRFRFKDYGVEYRSPSNFWCAKEEHIRTVYDLVEHAVINYKQILNDSGVRANLVRDCFRKQAPGTVPITNFYKGYVEKAESTEKIPSIKSAD